jgi:integrase
MGRHAEGWKLEWRGKSGHKIGYVRFTHAKQQHLISTGKRDPREAGQEAARLYARVVEGGSARPASTSNLLSASLESLWAEWLASLVGTLDVETLRTYETTYVGKHWPDYYKSIAEMCSDVARERYRSARLKLATARTVKKETWVQDKFLRWCRQLKIIGETPARLEWDKRMLGTRTGPQREVARELTTGQVVAVLAVLPEWMETGKRALRKQPYPIRDRFVFAYETSLRPATLSEIVWADWNESDGRLVIRPSVDKTRFGRSVPLSEEAQAALGRVRAGYNARGLVVGPLTPIFGKHLYRKTLKRAAVAAGLDGVAPYDFRHARATHLADAGASLTGIGHILGHKQATTTSRYLHGSMRAAEAALSRSITIPSLEASEKAGWPTGLEPATSGATKHGHTNNTNDLAGEGTVAGGHKPADTAKYLESAADSPPLVRPDSDVATPLFSDVGPSGLPEFFAVRTDVLRASHAALYGDMAARVLRVSP